MNDSANIIKIRAPRWHDRTLLIADWKIGGQNYVEIEAKRKDGSRFYPYPIPVSGDKLRSYPLVNAQGFDLREVPLDDLL